MKDILNFCLEYIRAHTFAVSFALLGLVLGIMILAIGFWRTLLLAVLTIGGAAFGAYLDKRKKIEKNNESFDTLYRFDDYRG